MARPRKEGMDYFPHDVHLSSDKKVEALRVLYGNDGYAFFCIMLENIYQEPNFELDVSDAETIQILAKKVEVTIEKLSRMIETALKHGIYDRDLYEKNKVLTSNGIKKRASVVVKKRVAARDSYGESVSDVVSVAETTQTGPQSKVKVKVKDKVTDKVTDKEKPLKDKASANATARFKKPSLDEVRDYCFERGNLVDAETWFDFYEAKGWKIGSTPMKNWKAAVRTWENKRGGVGNAAHGGRGKGVSPIPKKTPGVTAGAKTGWINKPADYVPGEYDDSGLL